MNEVKAIRTELGLNQREFGERLGMSQSRVAHWERGADTPDTRTLLAMRWLLHEHRTNAARAAMSPAPLAAILNRLGGHVAVAEGAGISVTVLEKMEAEGRIWPQYRRQIVDLAARRGLLLDPDALTLTVFPEHPGAAA